MSDNTLQQNQVIAIEKGVKSRTQRVLTDLHHAMQKPSLVSGQIKNFKKVDEAFPDQPAENIKVQFIVDDVLKKVEKALVELLDVTATKDWGNCEAKADIVVKGKTLIEQVPVSYLLFLEKQLVDLHTFLLKLPTLDPAFDWTRDENSKLFKTAPLQVQRTHKTQQPIVLYDATPEHPAQTQLISIDKLAGYWETVQLSGALPIPKHEELLERTETLQKAVKEARERGNSCKIEKREVGEKLLNYIFTGTC